MCEFIHPQSRRPEIAIDLILIESSSPISRLRCLFSSRADLLTLFLINSSSSMRRQDRQPLPNTPVTPRIIARANNRYGAVLSSLHSFWIARAAVIAGSSAARRDAYSVILFDNGVVTPITNDFTSTPDQLLDALLGYGTGRGTNFTLSIQQAQTVMERNWSNER